MWKQLILPFDDEDELKGVWEAISPQGREEFIAVFSMLLVKVTGVSKIQEVENLYE